MSPEEDPPLDAAASDDAFDDAASLGGSADAVTDTPEEATAGGSTAPASPQENRESASGPADSATPADDGGSTSKEPAPKKKPRSRKPGAKSKRKSKAKRAKKSDVADESSAFPFMEESAPIEDVDVAAQDESIAALSDHDLMQTMADDSALALDQAVAEAAAAARAENENEPPHVEAGVVATEPAASTAGSAGAPAAVASIASKARAILSQARAILGAGGMRALLGRSAIAAGVALAAGFGYGAAAKIFFAGDEPHLSEKIEASENALSNPVEPTQHDAVEGATFTQIDPRDTDPHATDPHATGPQSAVATHDSSAVGSEDVDPQGDETALSVSSDESSEDGGALDPVAPPANAAQVAEDSFDDAAADEPKNDPGKPRESKVVTRLVGPEQPFAMPEIGTSLPRPEHPLANGRQRLDRGDIEAARRIAADFLLREDGLSAEDRLFIPQAYALLADCLKVEWGRARAESLRETKKSGKTHPTTRPTPSSAEEGS